METEKEEKIRNRKKKRDRSVNFSLEETALLIILVEKRKDIVENKKSDAVTWQQKEMAWYAIEKEFNVASKFVFRSSKNLKTKYEALKRDTRRKFKYGDGPRTSPVLGCAPSEENNKLRDKINSFLKGLDNMLDSEQVSEFEDGEEFEESVFDASSNNDFEAETGEEIIIKNEALEIEDAENPCQPSVVPEIEVNPLAFDTNLRQPIIQKPSPIKFKKFKKSSLSKLNEAKIEVALLQKKVLQQEYDHKQKLNELEIKQQLLKIQILQKELDAKDKA